MSSLWVKTWKNTPRIDCGLCGESNCSSFSRALIVGKKSIDACPLLGLEKYSDLADELEKLSERKPTLIGKPASKLPEDGMILTKPCKDTDEKVMAELRVFNGVEAGNPIHYGVFEPGLLCDLMDCIAARFELTRCSRDLGYGRAEIEDMSITILQDGRLNMRRVSDETRVLELFKQIERAIFGSVICNCCGNDLLSVLAGFAPSIEAEHTVLSAGSTLSLDPEVLKGSFGRDVILNQPGNAGAQIAEAISDALNRLEAALEHLESRDFSSASYGLETNECVIVEAAVSATDDTLYTIAIMSLALLRAIHNAQLGIDELGKLLQNSPDDVMRSAIELLSKAKEGSLSKSDAQSDEMIESLAHLARVNRACKLLQDWHWKD
ncbi:MAG: (Fe-S)-binding protein [Candidatus Thorarchaeota archaeon]